MEDYKFDVYDADFLNFNSLVDKYFCKQDIGNATVLIKVDLYSGMKSIQSGTATNPEHVDAFISALNKYNPKKIIIAESKNKENVLRLFDEMGFSGIAGKYSNVELLDLTESPKISFLGDKKSKFRNLAFCEEMLLVDFFVNFSVLKLDFLEKISGCWLNQINFLPDANQKVYLRPFSSSLALDIFKLFKSSFCFLDLNIILKNMGPVEGFPEKIGKIIVGDNPLAVDSVGAKMIGAGYKSIPSIKYSARKIRIEKKLELDTRNIKIIKEAEFSPKFNFFLSRLSLFFGRMSCYISNFANFIFLGNLAVSSIGGKELATGKWMSFSSYFKIARELIFKIADPENLLNWKIAINKHVKEKSIS